ncbi:cysteine synthase B [Immersiella caudata]|uniref:Cysteine synthase B n=1 Tax=Immersiella caudata TaxID=314043 RepID=A0AA39WX17_9PEZI|nr:cysteine synthase B [Immersiella caudata]
MASPSPLNVFRGHDSLAQYLDPDQNPPLPLVEIPDALNPLRADGVRIFAKMLTALPAHNVKSLPALEMLRSKPKAQHQTIVEASSGSTVLSLAIIARALWGHNDVHAYVTNKKHPDSLRLMKFFGLKTVLYGGLAQQEPSDEKGIMSRLRRMAASEEGVCYPGQYDSDENWKAHERWTGAQIWRQLPEVNVFCATVGTGGCITGTGAHLKAMKPSVRTIGVCSKHGDPVPGPRHLSGFETSPFPWRENIDVFQDVSSADAFRASMQLSRHGLICGPSSGQALCGLIAHLQAAKAAGQLAEYADPTTKEINAVFVCADLPYQYMDLYFQKISKEEFPPTFNENLLYCDLDPYDERNSLSPEDASKLAGGIQPCSAPSSCSCNKKHHHQRQDALPSPPSSSGGSPYYPHPSSTSLPTPPEFPSIGLLDPSEDDYQESNTTIIIDIRPRDAYATAHMHKAWNVPLTPEPEDFFGDALAVEARWREIREVIGGPLWPGAEELQERRVLVMCESGDSSRMMVAMLRARGVEAFAVEGRYGGN